MKKFNFSGSNHTKFCSCKKPHVPHIIGEYKTVCNGWQQYFCMGKDGEGIKINIESFWGGDAYYPAEVRGNYTK